MSEYTLSAKFNLVDRVSDKLRGISKKLNDVGVDVGYLEDKIGNLGSAGVKAFKYLSVATLGIGVAGIKAAADFQKLSVQMNTAFKEAPELAKEYYKWANEFANVTPYSNEEVVGATVKLKMQKFDPKKVLGDVADMASAMGKPLDQAVEAFLDTSRGEFERLKEFGLSKEQLASFARSEGLGDLFNAKGQNKDPKKTMDALVKYIRKNWNGATKDLSKTFNGQWSTVMGNIKFNLARVFGLTTDGLIREGSVLDRLVKKMDQFNSYIASPAFQKKFEETVSYMENDFLPKIVATFNELTDWLGNITKADLVDWGNTIKTVLDGIAATFKAVTATIKAFNDALDINFKIGKGLGNITQDVFTFGKTAFDRGQQIDQINAMTDALGMNRMDVNSLTSTKSDLQSILEGLQLKMIHKNQGVGSEKLQTGKKVEVKIDMSNMKIDGGTTREDVENIINTAVNKWELNLSDRLMLGGGI